MYICKAYDYTLKLHSTITLKKTKIKGRPRFGGYSIQSLEFSLTTFFYSIWKVH